MAELVISGVRTTPITSANVANGDTIRGDGQPGTRMESYISLSGRSNVTVRDLTMVYRTNIAQSTALLFYNCSDCVALRLNITTNNVDKHGIILNGPSATPTTRTRIEDCTFHDISPITSLDFGVHGIYNSFATFTTVRGCLFYEIHGGYGVHDWSNTNAGFPQDTVIENCLFDTCKGGVIIADAERRAIVRKMVATNCGVGFVPSRAGLHVWSIKHDEHYFEVRGFNNMPSTYYKEGGIAIPNTTVINPANADPLYVNRLARDYRMQNQAYVGWGPSWLQPTGTPPPDPPGPPQGGMFVDASTAITTTQTVTIQPPAGQVGDLLLAFVYSDGNTGSQLWGAPPGWTKINEYAFPTVDGTYWLGYKVATAATEPATSWSQPAPAGIVPVAECIRLRGQKLTGWLSAWAHSPNSVSTLCTAPSIVPQHANCLLMFFGGSRSGVTSFTPPAGMTEHADRTGQPTGMTYYGAVTAASQQLATAAGISTGARQATMNVGRNNVGILLAVAPEGTAQGPTYTDTVTVVASSTVAVVEQSRKRRKPASVVSAGGWVAEPAGTLAQVLDEDVADDADYAESSDAPVTADVSQVALETSTDPALHTDHAVRYRYRRQGLDELDLTVRLMEGSTEIASWQHVSVSTDWQDAVQELSTGQAAAISDYNDLRVKLEAVRTS